MIRQPFEEQVLRIFFLAIDSIHSENSVWINLVNDRFCWLSDGPEFIEGRFWMISFNK